MGTERTKRIERPNAASAPDEAVFCREGEYWTIIYERRLIRLRDGKGLRYLAILLGRPGTAITAVDLTADTGRAPRSWEAGAAGAEQARSAVTKRIKDAIRKIAAHHPGLAYHLRAAVRTGARCIYDPGCGPPVTWTMDNVERRAWPGRGEGTHV